MACAGSVAGRAKVRVCCARLRGPLVCKPPLGHPLLLIAPSPQIADLIGAGKVRLEVALSLPLEQAAKAHDQVQTGHTRGKVVLTV